MHRTLRTLRHLSVAAALGVAACARTNRPADVGPATGPATISFSNQSLDVATVYAISSGGDARRIGSVAGGRTETLRLPSDLATAGLVTIVALPLASNHAASSGQISVRPGDRLDITLPMSQNILTVLPARPQ